MPQATSPLSSQNAAHHQEGEVARLQHLCRELKVAEAKAQQASDEHEVSDLAWFAAKGATRASEDTPERREQQRTEQAQEAALDECARILREIALQPATSGEALDIKIGVLKAVLADEKADLSDIDTTDTTNALAYSLARDVALIRGVL